ncbi:high-affinity nickel-transporter [Ancylobacter novellus DSM 506]|uniref:Nickel/cobalt efflux system n=1 Tax=Ancylobacter novellus (strain ATCC 8093 / DSM 506 / JCM 20403 / CCM 1077 / IAM 12100 / NBRC 12443 / NCIMB 10456) TaxID=639283 RepID=D7A5Z9_ANCN5|nr:nickel/cobalt transporter [Ancylobacter novellus]ADH90114.1 high-affinity nickel-transporter [Ancylobacter novellus DSM 506]
MRQRLLLATLAIAAGWLSLHPAFAQSPFGVGAPPPPPESGGIAGYILAKQAEFYRLLTSAVRASKQDGSALALLGGISFAYGIFHAAGPGHGKAVISSYLLANEATLKRGIGLAFASAFAQALAAILVAGVFAVILGATAASMSRAVTIVEIAAYGLIVLIGLRLAYIKGRALLAAWRGVPAHVHGPDCGCEDGHGHMPGPEELPKGNSWREWWGAVLSVGLRPCSGAILVLVFALTQGIFWVGAASTLLMGVGTAITVSAIAAIAVFAKRAAVRLAANRPGSAGTVMLRGVEFLAALALIAFGLALMLGFMASERLTLG